MVLQVGVYQPPTPPLGLACLTGAGILWLPVSFPPLLGTPESLAALITAACLPQSLTSQQGSVTIAHTCRPDLPPLRPSLPTAFPRSPGEQIRDDSPQGARVSETQCAECALSVVTALASKSLPGALRVQVTMAGWRAGLGRLFCSLELARVNKTSRRLYLHPLL